MNTDTRRVLLVDAFTDEPLAGNAAGVVPDAAGLSEASMQAIARELGASETAFVLPVENQDEDADRRLRFFTPTREIDLCGHATVAAHAHLHEVGDLDADTTTTATNAGAVDVDVESDGTVWMHQTFESVEPVTPDYDRLGGALGIDPEALKDVGADLAPAVASTGLRYLLLPVNFLEHLSGADPDHEAIEALSEEFDLTGVYAFTFDTLESESTLHGRMFAPAAGIPEDPVTGTASGACAAYLRYVDAFEGETPSTLRFEQGHFVDRPGYVDVEFVDDADAEGAAGAAGDRDHGLRVGGRAVTALDGEVTVPAPDDGGDDIIEA
ncbi:PhzF family phenazine biosynthesis protein [Halobium salinum]|uniref:PhzF family phenazine biosynthesis protein n=1 Tax=Halobium salinum TaxID=1364940 RepID=A0ABD5PGT9_9EURY|nr:PhzF family phenazine biosynthesis protein [Halobium salinum]